MFFFYYVSWDEICCSRTLNMLKVLFIWAMMRKDHLNGVLCCIEGRVPGVYTKWSECHMQINDFPRNCYFKCESREEAMSYFSSLKNDHQCATYKKAKKCPTNKWAACLEGVVIFFYYSYFVVYVIFSSFS